MLLLVARERPLSTIAGACSFAVALYEVVEIASGRLYLAALDSPDGTTLIMVCCLIVVGLVALRRRSDLQAVAFSWVMALSCVFAYEAVYKWSFHLTPFARAMPPSELREFVLQLAVAATLLTGFAQHHFTWKRSTSGWLAVFCALWALWLLVGFPQLDGQMVFTPVLAWNLDYDQVYLVNRATKLTLFIVYATLFPALHLRRPSSTWAAGLVRSRREAGRPVPGPASTLRAPGR
jgi:hypothetical protein